MRFGLVLAFAIATSAAAQSLPRDLIGVWQDSREIASGWSGIYRFFPDGRYEFHFSEMDCRKQKLSSGGRWMLRGNTVALETTYEEVLIHRRADPDEGPDCITGDPSILKLDIPRHASFAITEMKTLPFNRDTDAVPVIRAHFGKRTFWRLRDDPNRTD